MGSKITKLPRSIVEEGIVEKLPFYGDAKAGTKEKAALFIGGRTKKGKRGYAVVTQHPHTVIDGITEDYMVRSGEIRINGKVVEPGQTVTCGLGGWHGIEGSGVIISTKYPVHKRGYCAGEKKSKEEGVEK